MVGAWFGSSKGEDKSSEIVAGNLQAYMLLAGEMLNKCLRGAQNPRVLLCTLRFLCSVRLAFHPAHLFLQRFPRQARIQAMPAAVIPRIP